MFRLQCPIALLFQFHQGFRIMDTLYLFIDIYMYIGINVCGIFKYNLLIQYLKCDRYFNIIYA